MASLNETRSVKIFIDGQQSDQTLKQLTANSRLLKNELYQLVPGTQAFIDKSKQLQQVNAHLDAVKQDVKGLEVSMESLKGVMESLGVAFSAAAAAEFGKELFNLETKADGVQLAFTKIGNTSGYLDKLREASKGLISDLNLEKLAVKANDANIPIEKMGTFLEFAQQRARDTGEDVTVLTTKLIEGLGKGTPKALAGLGISVAEVKDEFKKTGDMVEAVGNIISRQMAQAGKDVDGFGDIVESRATKWENLKERVAGLFKKIFSPELADNDEIEKQTKKELAQYKDYQKFKDDQLNDAIQKQLFREKLYAKQVGRAQSSLKSSQQKDKENDGDQPVSHDYSEQTEQIKKASEAYQGVRNALAALNKEKEKRSYGKSDGSVDAIDQQITKLKTLQGELSTTSAEWKKYDTQIKALEKQKDAITGAKPKDDPAAKKAKAEAEQTLQAFHDLAIQRKQFEAAELADTMSKNDKEVQQLQNKYDVFIQKEKEFLTRKGLTKAEVNATNANIGNLEGEKQKALNDLRVKQEKELVDRINAFRDQMNGKLRTQLDVEKEEINKHYDEEKKSAGNNLVELLTIGAARTQALAAADGREQKRLSEEKKNLQDQLGDISGDDSEANKEAKLKSEGDKALKELSQQYSAEAKLTKDYADARVLIEKATQEKIKQLREEYTKTDIDAGIQATETIASAAFTIEANNRNAQSDAQLKQLEQRKTDELNNANLTAAQKDAITQRYAAQESALKKQQWQAQHQADEEQALINGALAVTKTFVQYGFTPAGWVAAAGQAVETLAQIAIIDAQPVPQFAQGGYSAVDYSNPQGFVRRPTLFANSSSNRPFIAGEGNRTEYIVSSQQLKDPAVADFVGTLEAHRTTRRFDAGGFSNATLRANPSTGQPAAASSSHSQRLDHVEYHLGRVSSLLDKEIYRPVVFNNRAYVTQNDKNIAIQNNANG